MKNLKFEKYIKLRKEDFPEFSKKFKPLNLFDIKKWKEGKKYNLMFFDFYKKKWIKFTFLFRGIVLQKDGYEIHGDSKTTSNLPMMIPKNLGFNYVLYTISSDASPVVKL